MVKISDNFFKFSERGARGKRGKTGANGIQVWVSIFINYLILRIFFYRELKGN
jgi:hypothetical protein